MVICGNDEYKDESGNCVKIPVECARFNRVTNKCEGCKRGYYVNNGECVKVECDIGEFPSEYGAFCVRVSDLCDGYDPIFGSCTSCKNNGYKVVDGKCIQMVSALASCSARQKLGFGTCPNP